MGVVDIFNKFRQFWNVVWNGIKDAYSKVFKEPLQTKAQEWRETKRINFLDIFVGKLNNLTNTEATFEVVSDSIQADKLKELCKDLEGKRFDITSAMLADGDYYIFPATNSKGDIVHSYLTQQQVRILQTDGEEIKEIEGIIDWHVDKNNRIYFLCRNHKLDDNNTLTISYKVVDDRNQPTTLEKWEHLQGESVAFTNANIGIGRYKSPVSSRGLSTIYGVPLNFGCEEIETKIFNDLQLIEDEFENAKSKIFADPLILRKGNTRIQDEGYSIPENIFPIDTRGGQSNANIDIFSPAIRHSEHYDKLIADMALYEKQVGTSKGILTDNETTETATATAVKRANADTLALINKIRTAIDSGNEMTLKADAAFLNVAVDLWSYRSDWYDSFEDPAEQFNRLNMAIETGYAEKIDGIKWLFPSLSDEEAEKKLARIEKASKSDTDSALNRIFAGE